MRSARSSGPRRSRPDLPGGATLRAFEETDANELFALVDQDFGERGLHRIELAAAVENARSRAVAERLGFREEGVRRNGERHGDRFLDLVVYALLAPEWRSSG